MVEHKVPKEIMDYYAEFRNSKTKFKTSLILGTTRFEIDERYEIIDSSMNFSKLLEFVFFRSFV
jgi:hypothetical protein